MAFPPNLKGVKGSSTGCEGVLWDPQGPLELAALPTAQRLPRASV
jgi:hypothetical protein